MKIFSGIRPTGKLHIGNYLGAVKQWVKLQDENEVIFFIVDYHAITTPWEKDELEKNIFNTTIDYLAAGINPEKSIITLQSQVPQHTELAWIFASITPLSWFERMPTFKEKLATKPEYVSLGLLSYPSLMAADILLYNTSHVPVGEDQLPHIEMTNQIAKRFNNKMGETFQEVKPLLSNGARIMSLQDPTKKMSKTGDESIAMSDGPDIIREKIKKAVTDSGAEIKYSKDKPALSNLLTIYSEFSDKKIKDIEKNYNNKGYAEFKKDLAEVIINSLKNFRNKREEILKDKTYVIDVLKKGNQVAEKKAQETMKKVKKKIGAL